MTKNELKTSSWFTGPKWLTLSTNQWPNIQSLESTQDLLESFESETRKSKITLESALVNSTGEFDRIGPFGLDPEKYSSYSKLIRVTAWMNRFINNSKKTSNEKRGLQIQELETAKLLREKKIQRDCFEDCFKSIKNKTRCDLVRDLGLHVESNGLLRCQGRLDNAKLLQDTAHPKLLPKEHAYTKLLIRYFHVKVMHAGVSQTLAKIRTEYWIPHGRRVVQSVL